MSMKEETKDIPKWVATMGRIGYISKAIVYVLIGVLALLLAAGVRSESAGKDGALRVISEMWYGTTLLVLIGIGVIFYGLWRYVEVIYDPANLGCKAKGSIKKIGYAITGTTYILLGVQAFNIIGKSKNQNSQGGGSDWTSGLMQNVAGRVLVGIIGGVIIGYGVYNLYRACSDNFEKKLELSAMSADQKKWAFRAGRAGYTAMFINYSFLGSFLIASAVKAKSQGGGLSTTLTLLLEQPFGSWLLGFMAVGLIFYGIFMGYLARFRPVFRQDDALPV